MAHLLVNRQALLHNLHGIREACYAQNAAFMPVFKEAGIRPDLLRFMLASAAFDRIGLCHFPGVTVPSVSGIQSHLLYLVPTEELATVAGSYDVTYQTGVRALRLLAQEAQRQGRTFRIVLPVEAGDGRDGVMPDQLTELAIQISELAPHIELYGLSVNFACISDRAPRIEDILQLLSFRNAVQQCTGRLVPHVSVGGSDILELAATEGLPSGVTEIRCGTAIYLGVYPLDGKPVPGLRQGAVRLSAQIVEYARKQGRLRAVFDFGSSDTSPELVDPAYPGMAFVGASSGYSLFDVTDCSHPLCEGDRVLFDLHHRSLARALSAPRLPLRME